MKVKTLSVSVSEVINCGNYETIRPEVTLEADLDEGDDLKKCNDELWRTAKSLWAANALFEIGMLIKRRKDKRKIALLEETADLREGLRDLISD